MEKAKVTKGGVRNQGKTRAKGQKFTRWKVLLSFVKSFH